MNINLKQRQKTSGFTIIEVMIVLAIAALILLIVFLAVPAFQRNQRNTARKGDVGRLGSAVVNFVANNNNNVPACAQTPGNAAAILADAGAMGHYRTLAANEVCGATPTNMQLIIAAGAQAAFDPAATPVPVDAVRIVTNAVCTATGATTAGTSTRQIAIQYMVETATAGQAQCYNVS